MLFPITVAIHLADAHAPILVACRESHDWTMLRATIEQSVTGDHSRPGRDCLGQPFLILGGQWVNPQHITRMTIVPAADLAPAHDPAPQVGFDLIGP